MSQLERLAKPFPAKYVKPPAQGKYGNYIDHEIVNQALLIILGPFSFEVQQVFYSPEGLLDGCTASLTAVIDGREVTVTEAGDCEHAQQKKTQGDRLKNAASDALKRCAMRLGCGLHVWAGDKDFFLYEQLRRQNAEAGRATSVGPAAPSAPSPAGTHEHPTADAAGPGSSPIVAGPATSKARIQTLVSRATALRADRVDVDQAQKDWNLPDLKDCDDKQLDLWDEMLADEEKTLAAPFERHDKEMANLGLGGNP